MVQNYRKGNIYRIYLKHFLTYETVEIFPKPHLNVIIGANGTGKSSVLCGICIGLGGKPELTGRGRSLTEYVKQGKESSITEIELFNTDGENFIVRREFGRNNDSSNWFLNNRKVREKDINSLIAALGIHVNNLCQFLPQDRVVEFSKMNEIQLLSSTEKAVGEMQLFDQHETLSKFGKSVQDINIQLKDIQAQLANEVKKNSQLEDQVRNIKAKEDLNTSIENLRQLIVFRNYNNHRAMTVEIGEKLKVLKNACDRLMKKMRPTQSKIDQIDADLKDQSDLLRRKNEEGKSLRKKALHQLSMCDKEEDRIKMVKEEYRNLESCNRGREREIVDLKKQLEGFLGQLSGVMEVDENVLVQQINELTAQISNLSHDLTTVQSIIGNINMELNALSQEVQAHETQLNNLRDTKARRLQILQTKNRAAFNATQWLENNRRMFRGIVHDPLFALIDCHDEMYSKYLENVVSNQDLVAFVCEDKSDVKTLKIEADRYKWPINILYAPPVDPNTFMPKHPIEQLRHLGFDCYVRDIIKGPNAIISFLCRNYKIHNIPIARRADFEKVPTDITLFFIDNQRYSKKQSLYDRMWSTNISDLKRTQFLTHSTNTKDEENIVESLKVLHERLEFCKDQKFSHKTKEGKIESLLEKMRTDKKDKWVIKDQRKQLQVRIAQKQEQISRRQNNIIDLESAKIKMHADTKNLVGKLVFSFNKLTCIEKNISEELQCVLDQSFICSELNMKKRTLLESLEHIETQITAILEEQKIEESRKKELNIRSKGFLAELCQSLGVPSHSDIPKECLTFFKTHKRETPLEDLENQLVAKKAHRDCLVTGDDGILLEYDNRKEKINQLKEQEESKRQSIENERSEVEACRLSWLPRIEELISNINQHFAKFMENLGCAGEVQLDKGNDENDFSQYGLSISVKFRDSEKLKKLTVHQQSGGERSVSTALYLMALQTLTAVPFRCVDEINQGMDPTNERKMFTMLVRSTTNANASQYFLITPKLLPYLPYNKHVTFLNIFNWYTTTKVKHLRTSKILQYHKRSKERRRNNRN